MAFENQEIHYETIMAENQEATNNTGANSKNHDANHGANNRMNDEFFRNFMQFMQNQARRAPIHNTGGSTDNVRMVTAKQFKELGPPEFFGKPEPLKAEAWLKQLTKIFDVLCCTDEQKVPFATFMLRGEADHWWESVKRTHHSALQMSWVEFQELFNEKYFPESIRHMKEVEFIKLEQNNMTVSQYEAKFAELSRFASHLVDSEERMTRMFLRGLKPEIRKYLVSHKICLYSDAVDRAQVVEQEKEILQPGSNTQQRERNYDNNRNGGNNNRNSDNQRGGNYHARNGNHFSGNPGPDDRGSESSGNNSKKRRFNNNQGNAPAPVPVAREGERPPVICYKCGKEGHISPNCTNPPKVCYNCGKEGHISRFCRITKSSSAVTMTPRVDTNKSKPVVQGRAFVITSQNAQKSDDVITGEQM